MKTKNSNLKKWINHVIEYSKKDFNEITLNDREKLLKCMENLKTYLDNDNNVITEDVWEDIGKDDRTKKLATIGMCILLITQ
jgi:hypothetical protein